jgi:hypothetical protein
LNDVYTRGEELIQISHRLLAKNSNRFTRNPVLDAFPCTLKFQASITDLQQFVPALEAKTVQTMHDNFRNFTACFSKFRDCE